MIVVLDACVLYPPSLRDMLLTLGAFDAYHVRWSEDILEEVTRNVLQDHPEIDRTRFTGHTIASMRAAFPAAMTAASSDAMTTADNEPKDRHVAAIALTAEAHAIVTLNVKHFRGQALPRAGIAVMTPGALVSALLDDAPDVVVLAIQHLSHRWLDPPRTPVEITHDLAVHPSMAEPMGRLRDLLG